MNFIKTDIEGVVLIGNKHLHDQRGSFFKAFQKSLFKNNITEFDISEHFYSVSQKGVIRGMHFQNPPHTQEKLVYVVCGKIIDVVVDLRKKSETYKQFRTFELNSDNNHVLFLPAGVAHGFQGLEDNSITMYLQSNEYNKDSDSGVNPLSLDFDWPIQDYIISDKDKNFESLKHFNSPF